MSQFSAIAAAKRAVCVLECRFWVYAFNYAPFGNLAGTIDPNGDLSKSLAQRGRRL